MIQTIKHLIVIPKTIHSGVYYINNNMKDGHYKKYDELYLFIAEMLHPPATLEVHENIYTHQPFYVDVENNYVETLTFESASFIEELKQNTLKDVHKSIKRLLSQKDEETKKDLPLFQKALDNYLSKAIPMSKISKPSNKEDSGVQKDNRNRSARIYMGF